MSGLERRLARLESLVPRREVEPLDLFQFIAERAEQYRRGDLDAAVLPYADAVRNALARQP